MPSTLEVMERFTFCADFLEEVEDDLSSTAIVGEFRIFSSVFEKQLAQSSRSLLVG